MPFEVFLSYSPMLTETKKKKKNGENPKFEIRQSLYNVGRDPP